MCSVKDEGVVRWPHPLSLHAQALGSLFSELKKMHRRYHYQGTSHRCRRGVRNVCSEYKAGRHTISQNLFDLHECKDLRRKINLENFKTLFQLPLKPGSDNLMSKTSAEALMMNSPMRRQ